MKEQEQALDPNFHILDETLPYSDSAGDRLPNPLKRYLRILEQRISGTLSTIHGDLHTANILIGPGGGPGLIDFEWTRVGHTLFEWAVLESSMLLDHVPLSVGRVSDELWHAV